MAIGGAFLGGGVELVPAGSCKLELEAYTDNATVSATFTITGGGNTYTVTSGTDGRASKVVPSGVTYTVSATVTGYTAPPSQTVIAESSSIKYVRFDAQLKKAQGDISTLQTDVDKAEGDISTLKTDVGNAQGDISTLQADVKRAQSTADSKAGTDVATQSANGLMSKDDKIKLDGIEDTYATITAVQNAQATADGKVSKSGDTMTGNLSIQNDSPRILTLKNTSISKNYEKYKQVGIINGNASDGTIGKIEFLRNTPFGFLGSGVIISAYNPTGSQQAISIYSFDDGVNQEAYVQHPSWKVGTNDNSDKSLTIKMANSLPSLVHTTGNEDISGFKKFQSGIALKNDGTKAVTFMMADGTEVGYLSMSASGDMWIKSSTGKITLESPNGTVNAPTTPSGASGTEIVTADWALSKFQRKITYGTGDPPSGGQAGDIYIKI